MTLIALTGVPGTGKTSVARILRCSGSTVLDLNAFVREHGLVLGMDRKRNTKEVDIKALGRLVKAMDVKGRQVFLEGHLSHLLPVDRAIVLRCAPAVLRRRLMARRWKAAKVRENLEAEAMGVITQECRDADLDCFEIDVSNIKPQDVARLVSRLARSRRGVKGYRPGKIDYFEEILKWY